MGLLLIIIYLLPPHTRICKAGLKEKAVRNLLALSTVGFGLLRAQQQLLLRSCPPPNAAGRTQTQPRNHQRGEEMGMGHPRETNGASSDVSQPR